MAVRAAGLFVHIQVILPDFIYHNCSSQYCGMSCILGALHLAGSCVFSACFSISPRLP